MLTNQFDGCSTISDEDFASVLESCDFRDGKQVNDLIAKTYTPFKFNEQVAEKHFNKPDSAYNYFTGFYPTRVWEDGQGQDEYSELYYAPTIGYDFSRFIRTMQICDPNAANECNECFEELPDGARGVLPPMEMYKWGVKTPPQCIANMRHIRDFRSWGSRLLRGWRSVDEQIANMFFMFASIRLTGHKLVMQGVRDANGQIQAYPNTDPKNPFQGFAYNYQQPMFPSVVDADLIMPLEYQYLEVAARYWAHWNNDNHVAIGNRGQKVYEMWYPEDWYRDNVLKNPEFFEAIKEYMPAETMAGYSLMNTKREILGNWAIRQMPMLPRFAESTEGGLIPIDNFVTEQVEFGNRPVPAGRDWLNAPFLMMTMPSPKSGEILYRPDITTSIEGWPIKPIMGNGGWVIRNEYDKECNPQKNMPWSERRYEIGFKLRDPDAAMSAIFRSKVFRIAPSNECEWAPNARKVPATHNCASSLTCNDNQRHAPSVVTTIDDSAYVECSCQTCGDDTIMRLKLTREAYKKDYTPIDCECGDTLWALIGNSSGDVIRKESVTLIEQMPWPNSLYWVQLSEALADGECIKGLKCKDSTPNVGRVLDCWDDTMEGMASLNGDLKLLLDAPINCEAGDNVLLKAYDSSDTLLTTVSATIVSENAGKDVYVVSGTGDLVCGLGEADFSYMTITCD
jgi:hypothetical protein